MRVLKRFTARRRGMAALFAGGSVASVLLVLGGPEGVEVLVASRDLPGGRVDAADFVNARIPVGGVPEGVVRPGSDVAGRVLVGPMRRGEALTDVRVLGPGLLNAKEKGLVAMPVRVADPEAARLVSAGDVVDVLAAFGGGPGVGQGVAGGGFDEGDAGSGVEGFGSGFGGGFVGRARVVVGQVDVLARPARSSASSSGNGGGLVVLAVTPDQAAQLAQAQVQGPLSIVIHPR